MGEAVAGVGWPRAPGEPTAEQRGELVAEPEPQVEALEGALPDAVHAVRRLRLRQHIFECHLPKRNQKRRQGRVQVPSTQIM